MKLSLALVTMGMGLGLAACGSTRIVTVTSPGVTVTKTVSGGRLASSGECQVANGTAEMIFYSATAPVRGFCRGQVRQTGWRAGHQTAAAGGSEVLVCYLHSPTSDVVASVFDTRTGSVGPRTCRGYIDERWQVLQADARICLKPNGATVTLPPGAHCRS